MIDCMVNPAPVFMGLEESVAPAGGGGGGGATWASIWADQAHIYDLKPANVVLDGVTGKLERVLNAGSADASYRQQIGDLDFTAEDADFNGLPSISQATSYRLIAYNAANTASLQLADFITASEGYFSALVMLSNENGEDTTNAQGLPGIVGSGSGWIGLGYAGADQIVRAGAFSSGYKNVSGALARNTPALVTWVKTTTHLQLWINATKVDEIACGNISGTNGVVYHCYGYGGENGKGKFGPWAAGKSVPEDLETRIAAACTLAGIS